MVKKNKVSKLILGNSINSDNSITFELELIKPIKEKSLDVSTHRIYKNPNWNINHSNKFIINLIITYK